MRPHLLLALASLAIACSPTPDPAEDTTEDAGATDLGVNEEDAGEAPDTAADATADAGAEPIDPLELPPGEPGPFGTGYTSFEHTYVPFEGAAERTITVNVWYPTSVAGGPPARYLGTFVDRDTRVDVDAAPPAYASGRYPVHVHSHGDQGFGGSCSHMMRYFASHGWVTVAPDHTDNTIQDNVQPREVAMYYWRPLDLSASLDALEGLPADHPLSGTSDTSKVLLSGYSFGAYTAWAAAGTSFDAGAIDAQCEGAIERGASACTDADRAAFAAGFSDPRIVAAIPIAGTLRTSWFGQTGHTSVDVPVLTITGSQDNPESAAEQWERVTDLPMTWVELEGACHAAFSFGGCADIESDVGFAITDTYMLAHGRAHVLGDEGDEVAGVLDGTTEVNSLATVRRR